MERMRELVEMVVKALADKPDEAVVTAYEEDDATILEVRVSNEDLGRIIGRDGRVARALRSLTATAGMKLRRKLFLEIAE